MSHIHNDKFLQNGGKCPTVIPTSFHKKEENVSPLFCQGLKKRRRKMSFFLFTIFQIWEENFLESIMGDLNPRQIKSQEY